MDSLLFSRDEFSGPSPGEVAGQTASEDALEPLNPVGKPRLRVPHRKQVEMRWASLDEMLEPGHPARAVWAAVAALDLNRWLGEIKAVEGQCGRDATDPRLLAALWIYAT